MLLIAVGVDYNVFLMTRLNEESQRRGLRAGIIRAIGQTGGLISSAALITASSFASFMLSPLGSLRQLGFALVVGILVDAVLVRPLLVPCGHWLLRRTREVLSPRRRHSQGPARVRGGGGLSLQAAVRGRPPRSPRSPRFSRPHSGGSSVGALRELAKFWNRRRGIPAEIPQGGGGGEAYRRLF